jgi:hypothetical protein
MMAHENTETQPIDMIAMFREEGIITPAMTAPEEPLWSRWLHYYPELVATMATQAGVSEGEVIEHLGQIAAEMWAESKAGLHSDEEVVRRYLNNFVAVG